MLGSRLSLRSLDRPQPPPPSQAGLSPIRPVPLGQGATPSTTAAAQRRGSAAATIAAAAAAAAVPPAVLYLCRPLTHHPDGGRARPDGRPAGLVLAGRGGRRRAGAAADEWLPALPQRGADAAARRVAGAGDLRHRLADRLAQRGWLQALRGDLRLDRGRLCAGL